MTKLSTTLETSPLVTEKKLLQGKQSSKLIFATHYSDDINRIKRIFKKHWTLIKNNTLLNHIFPSPPVIAYKANPSLRKKLIRARLKPLDQTNPNPMPDQNTQEESQQSNPIIPSTYLNTPLKIIEIQSKDVTKNVTV